MTRLCLILLVVLAGLAAPAAGADAPSSDLGLELVPWSRKVGDHRYESPRDYEGTIKFFKDKFKGYKTIKWSREVSLPSVKYIHFESTAPGSKWQGVNIYALPDGRVRYYLLAPVPKPPAPAANANPAG